MLSAPRPRSTFSNEQVSAYVFTPCSDQHGEPIPEYFRCCCGKVRKQTRRNGFTNLMQHFRGKHPSLQEEMLAATPATTGSVEHYARRTAMNRFGRLEWIVRANLPPIFCENALARRYVILKANSVDTLRATMEGVTRLLEAAIGVELPDEFGLVLDGWSHASEHYVVV
ncbi:hypothetical protein JG687_00008504 [Phytophthora cactorum]|uniref:Uncharacterized protein n=2 Tax=Phytophthora cactorum TaxID=29920 RepID=A0A8T1UHB9_9STRA|nr:hypothetical protein JG687_00008504 [Phytophthora cactorum]